MILANTVAVLNNFGITFFFLLRSTQFWVFYTSNFDFRKIAITMLYQVTGLLTGCFFVSGTWLSGPPLKTFVLC